MFKYKKLWNLKAFILAFEVSFIFCSILGTFYNPPITTKLYDSTHRFYINRGYPVAWAGISAIDKTVELPIVKAPFIKKDLPYKLNGTKWVKVIDLRKFTPLFLAALFVSYIFSFLFAMGSEENKNLHVILTPTYFILLIGCVYFYFFWFSRI